MSGRQPAPGSPFGQSIDDVVIATDPGCSSDLHRQEIYGAMMALSMGHRWWDETVMDCGCTLKLMRVEDL